MANYGIKNNSRNYVYNHGLDKTEQVENSFVRGIQKTDSFVTTNLETKKIKWLLIFIISIFSILISRIGYLQIVQGDIYREAAEDNRIRITQLKAPRGIIYDRNGIQLAHNIPNFTLSMVTADLPKDKTEIYKIIDRIATLLELDATELRGEWSARPEFSYEPYAIADHIPYEKALLLKIASAEMQGITLTVSSFREYEAGNFFTPVLGYMGKATEAELISNQNLSYDDYVGKTGIEFYYNNILMGQHGKKEIEVDSKGKESKIINISPPTQGKNLFLTIDTDLQNNLGMALQKIIDQHKTVTGAAAVAINPNNGAVLALVSIPTYDNNAFTQGLSEDQYQAIITDENNSLFNRPVAGEYPSGSTIKPVIAATALENGVIDENTIINSTGGIQVNQWFFPDWKAGGHGVTDVKKAIAESVNTFFYSIGGGTENFTGLGIDRLAAGLKKFGLGQRTQIDLNGEASGFIPSQQWKEETKNESWYIGDTYHLSIGQGDILVTPLQVAQYTATIANGGISYQPHLVQSINNSSNTVSSAVIPRVNQEHVASTSNIAIVRDGMRQAVTSGSARVLADLPFTSAGKTGTAQFGNDDKTHAWFTAFAPFDNPEIAITVLVEAGGEGNDTALPVVKNALLEWFSP